MIVSRTVSEAEITSTKVIVQESGLVATVTCFAKDGSSLVLTMSRDVLGRLSTQAFHELKRAPLPARRKSSR